MSCETEASGKDLRLKSVKAQCEGDATLLIKEINQLTFKDFIALPFDSRGGRELK